LLEFCESHRRLLYLTFEIQSDAIRHQGNDLNELNLLKVLAKIQGML